MTDLRLRYRQVRQGSEQICRPLAIEDYQIQSITETSPPKWHLAHVTWFFETFLLGPHEPGYQPFHPRFAVLFNSYYETVGEFHPRPRRGLLSRPTVEEVYAYRKAVDEAMERFFDRLEREPDPKLAFIVELGLNHEQQHQELACMDIKHNFSVNPLKPAYREDLAISPAMDARPVRWIERAAGMADIGHGDDGFAYDNESPRHPEYLPAFRIADRLVTNGEYLAFMQDGGYDRADLWLSDGWGHIQKHRWRHPLYWERQGEDWFEMTLGGLRPLHLAEPVCHVSHFEADAYARWAGKRLPREAEMEVMLAAQPVEGNFFDQDHLHPRPAGDAGQWFGDCWNWTASAYLPYPGFRPLAGSAGEYNGKFMSNQIVLRGGCCATSQNHARATYRNFFYPHERWPFTGIRLAEEA